MKQKKLSYLERYSRQIILKDIGLNGQKKLAKSKVLIVGLGGLGCPVADLLCRAGVGNLCLIDFDKVTLSNLHRQTLFTKNDIGKSKVSVAKRNLKNINPKIKIKIYSKKFQNIKVKSFLKNYDVIVDGSDNFKTKFLLNEYALKFKKKFIVGAISKFEGHIFSFDFKKKVPCLKCFYQGIPSDEVLNCEQEGVIGPIASLVGSVQSTEIIKKILDIGQDLNSKILIINLLDLSFRISKFKIKKECSCA